MENSYIGPSATETFRNSYCIRNSVIISRLYRVLKHDRRRDIESRFAITVSQEPSAILLCMHVYVFSLFLRVLSLVFPLIFRDETMPSSKVLALCKRVLHLPKARSWRARAPKYYVKMTLDEYRGLIGDTAHGDITRSRSCQLLGPLLT